MRVVTYYSHCVFSATWECVMLMGGTFDKGFVSGILLLVEGDCANYEL